MNPGDRVMLDRSIEVTLVRQVDEVSAIISYAGATSVVPLVALSLFEG